MLLNVLMIKWIEENSKKTITNLIDLVGIHNFFVKSTSKNLKIQTIYSDTRRSIIRY